MAEEELFTLLLDSEAEPGMAEEELFTLLLDSEAEPGMAEEELFTLLLDSEAEPGMAEEELFTLLLDSETEPGMANEEDSPRSKEDGSSLGTADADELQSSPHATSASVKGNKSVVRDGHHALFVAGFALRLLAITFRIRTPSPQRPGILLKYNLSYPTCPESAALPFKFPAAVVVVDHLAGHAAVDADVFAGNEAGLVAREVKYHVRDIQRVTDAACGLLRGIGTFVGLEIRIDPARRNGIHAHTARKTHGQRMRKRCNPALRRRIAFCLRLAHTVATRRNVYNARTFREMRCKKFREVERGRHAHGQCVVEFLVTALVNALHQRERVIHQHIHAPVLFDNE